MADNAIRDGRQASLLVRTMALLCMRNPALEDSHAGPAPVTRTGDYSDVTAVDAAGRRIPWPEVSHFGDDTMRALMREIAGNLYILPVLSRDSGFLERTAILNRSAASRWDGTNRKSWSLSCPVSPPERTARWRRCSGSMSAASPSLPIRSRSRGGLRRSRSPAIQSGVTRATVRNNPGSSNRNETAGDNPPRIG